MRLCYNYSAYEIIESGQRKEIVIMFTGFYLESYFFLKKFFMETVYRMPLCYNYTAYESLESGQRKEIVIMFTGFYLESYFLLKKFLWKLYEVC